jgi:y4mF family transcriptional regulator
MLYDPVQEHVMNSYRSEIERAAAGEGSIDQLMRGGATSPIDRAAQGLRDRSEISKILSGDRSTLPAAGRVLTAGPKDRSTPPPAGLTHERAALVPVTTVAELGALVKAARKRLKLPQQRFADLAGVGRRFVSELEAGKATLEADRVLRCCLAAGIDIFARARSS